MKIFLEINQHLIMIRTQIIALLFFALLTGCDSLNEHNGHAHDHGDGLEHDHSGDDEHVDRSRYLASYTAQDELYLQYETLVINRDSVFLAHFTRLSDFSPLPGGFITITLSGGGAPDEQFIGKRTVRDGIHIEVALPQHAGKRQLTVELETPDYTTIHDLGTVTVYSTYEASKTVPPRTRPANTTYLEKEAQWHSGIRVQQVKLDHNKQLTLPASALFSDGEEEVLFVLQEAEFFERRVIKHFLAHDHEIIIDEGLASGEYVVIHGAEAFLPDSKTSSSHHPDGIESGNAHNH